MYLAKEQALPCAPAANDWRSILHGRTQVDRAVWTENAQVIVLLKPVELSNKEVRLLRADGWEPTSLDDSAANGTAPPKNEADWPRWCDLPQLSSSLWI